MSVFGFSRSGGSGTVSSPVTSVFGRVGAIIAVAGDYNTSLVTEGSNLYYTDARARLALSGTAPIGYNNTTGVITWTGTTTDVPEGANLYYTNTRADARITAQKGAANGIAPLDSGGKIPTSYLPALAITDTSVVGSQAAMLALAAQTGDVAVRTDLSKTFILAGANPAVLGDWQELLTPGSAVLSVNGFTGAVTLVTTDITEGTNLYYTDVRVASYSDTHYIKNQTAAPQAAGMYINGTIRTTSSIQASGVIKSAASMGVFLDGSNAAQAGAYLYVSNTAGTREWDFQLNASNGTDIRYYDGATNAVKFQLNTDGSMVADTIYGSTISAGDLHLYSTSHATKGKIYFAPFIIIDTDTPRMSIGDNLNSYAFNLYGGSNYATFRMAGPASVLFKGAPNNGNGWEFWQDAGGSVHFNSNSATGGMNITWTGDIEYPNLTGTGNKVTYITSTGILVRSTIDPARILQDNTVNTFTGVTTFAAGASYRLEITGTASTIFKAINSSGNYGVWGEATGAGCGVYGQAGGNGGTGVQGQGTGINSSGVTAIGDTGFGITAHVTSGLAGYFYADPATTAASIEIIRMLGFSTGVTAAGFGAHMSYQLQNSSNLGISAAETGVRWITATNAIEEACFDIRIRKPGTSPANVFTIFAGGAIGYKTLVTAATALTLHSYSERTLVFTGGVATVWTMYAVGVAEHLIKNRGSANITLNSVGGGNDFWDSAAVNSITITPGQAIFISGDGTYWNII